MARMRTLPMQTLCLLTLLLLMQNPSSAFAQSAQAQPAANPMTRTLRLWWAIAAYTVRIAEAMPGDKYAFRPFANTRSFAEEVGHIADEHYLRCSRVRGEAAPVTAIEANVTRKEELVSKLKESVAYCDHAYETMTDSNLAGSWQQGNTRGINLGPLIANIAHDNEHASTIVMLMRMSGIAPPPLEGGLSPIG